MNKIIYALLISGTLCSLSAVKKDTSNYRMDLVFDLLKYETISHYGPTNDRDNITTIAKSLRKDNTYSIQKIAKLLYLLNTSSFINGNIDRLKDSEILNIPNLSQNSLKKDRFFVPEVKKPIPKDEVVVSEPEKVMVLPNQVVLELKGSELKLVEKVLVDKEKVLPLKKKLEPTYKYFVGVGLNANMLSVNKTDITGSILLNKEIDDKATSVNLQAGTKLKNYVLSANYEVLNLDDVKINTLYLSLDYTFESFLNPFIGISLGMSSLVWQTDPLVNSKNKDEKLSSLMYGLQVGINYPLYQNWSVYSVLAYQKLDFKTTLTSTPAETEVTHEAKMSIGAGIRYSF